MKSNKEQLKSRGFVEEQDMVNYSDYNRSQLLQLLGSKKATNRTIAATLLSKYEEDDTLKALITGLINEKKLYSKIALSESISRYGEKASHLLVEYLGLIGNNQHKVLPEKPFGKSNYPLPRDIIARTICKIGKPALKDLKGCLYHGTYRQILEAIDAIGYISYYEKDRTLQEDILKQFNRFSKDELMTWKLLRALQAFNDEKVLRFLDIYKNSSIPQHKWEATRSYEQLLRQTT